MDFETMLVTSQSDRHIGRTHAHTVSGALAHSSSLSAINSYPKRELSFEKDRKEVAHVTPLADLVDSKNSKDSILSDSKNLAENISSTSTTTDSDDSIGQIETIDSIDSIDSVNVSKDREAWKFAKESKEPASPKDGTFNFLAFRKVFTTRELTSKKPTTPRPLMRQKSYFLEEHVTYKESSLKAADLTSLQKILHDEVGLGTFRNFLKSVFAEENLQFWCDVNAFMQFPSDQKLYEAQKIYVLYIHDKATYPLNVAATTKSSIESKIESSSFVVEDDLFDEAKNEAYDLLERDLFPRFRKSPYFYRLQEGLDENLISQMVKKKTGFLSIFHT